MDARHGSRAQSWGGERSLEETDDVSRPADHVEHALEVIRRRLDSEFRRPSERAEATWDAASDAGSDEDGRPTWSSGRRRWVGTAAGALLLLACAVGGAVGAHAIMLYLKRADLPATAERATPRPGPGTTDGAIRPPAPPAPTPRPEVVLPPRPRRMPQPVLTLPEAHRPMARDDVKEADPSAWARQRNQRGQRQEPD